MKSNSAQNGDSGIIVYSHRSGDFEIETYVPPCFSKGESETFVRRGGQGDEETVVFTTERHLPYTLEPGETKAEYHIIADDPTTEGCFPSGSYHFEKGPAFEGSEVSLDFNVDIESV